MKTIDVTAAIIEKNGKVLLLRRNTEPFKGYWTLPGGHIEFGETAEQAIIREVKEEASLRFKPKFFGYRDEIYPEISWHGEVLLFHGESAGTEKADGREISDAKWVPLEEAAKIKLAFGHEKSIDDYLNSKNKFKFGGK